jgi:hypothetical protein
VGAANAITIVNVGVGVGVAVIVALFARPRRHNVCRDTVVIDVDVVARP